MTGTDARETRASLTAAIHGAVDALAPTIAWDCSQPFATATNARVTSLVIARVRSEVRAQANANGLGRDQVDAVERLLDSDGVRLCNAYYKTRRKTWREDSAARRERLARQRLYQRRLGLLRERRVTVAAHPDLAAACDTVFPGGLHVDVVSDQEDVLQDDNDDTDFMAHKPSSIGAGRGGYQSGPRRAKTFLVVRPAFRSRALTTFFEAVDSATRRDALAKTHAGKPQPVGRINRVLARHCNTNRAPPPGLSRACLDETWLASPAGIAYLADSPRSSGPSSLDTKPTLLNSSSSSAAAIAVSPPYTEPDSSSYSSSTPPLPNRSGSISTGISELNDKMMAVRLGSAPTTDVTDIFTNDYDVLSNPGNNDPCLLHDVTLPPNILLPQSIHHDVPLPHFPTTTTTPSSSSAAAAAVTTATTCPLFTCPETAMDATQCPINISTTASTEIITTTTIIPETTTISNNQCFQLMSQESTLNPCSNQHLAIVTDATNGLLATGQDICPTTSVTTAQQQQQQQQQLFGCPKELGNQPIDVCPTSEQDTRNVASDMFPIVSVEESLRILEPKSHDDCHEKHIELLTRHTKSELDMLSNGTISPEMIEQCPLAGTTLADMHGNGSSLDFNQVISQHNTKMRQMPQRSGVEDSVDDECPLFRQNRLRVESGCN